MQPTINMDRLTAVFASIRDHRAAKRREWEAADALLETDMQRIRAVMLDMLNNTGAKSIATAHGTVYRTEKIRPSAADWSAVYAWIVADPDRFELLEKRLKPTFVKQFMEENENALPPGVNVHREFEVSVRKPTT